MDYRKEFRVDPGDKVKLNKRDPAYTGKLRSEDDAKGQIETYHKKLVPAAGAPLRRAQALDPGRPAGARRRREGRHDQTRVFTVLNPQGVHVASFKQPTPDRARA